MSVLPITFEDKEDSPEFIAWLATFGAKKKMTAAEINLLRDAINELHTTKVPIVGGKIPKEYLPSYVDDVLEFIDFDAFPAVGESGKIYVDLEANSTYRWTGSAYVQIGGTSKKTDKITYTHTTANNINVLNTWFRFYNTQGWNNNVINASSETGVTPNLISTNGSSRPILPNSKLVKCVLSFTYASGASSSSFEVYVGTSEFTEGVVVGADAGINKQTLVLETVNFTSGTAMNLVKNLTINTHSTLPFNKLYFAVMEKATAKLYSFQLDFYFEEQ